MKLYCFFFAAIILQTVVAALSIVQKLSDSNINTADIGCKCIMTAPSGNKSDYTSCLCYNRVDGTLNDSHDCTQLQGKQKSTL
jgi:hypothetical protein